MLILFFPVKIFTTPEGTSELEITSAKEMELRGCFSEAITTHEFPETITGMIEEISPNKGLSSEENKPTIPMGSSSVKLKCEVATGFTAPKT